MDMHNSSDSYDELRKDLLHINDDIGMNRSSDEEESYHKIDLPRIKACIVSPSQLTEELEPPAHGVNCITNDAKTYQVKNKKRTSAK